MKTLRKISLATIAFGLCLSVSSSFGTSIVHWGGNYVSSSQNLNLANLSTSNGTFTRTWQFDSSKPITPTTAYTAPSGRTSRIDGVVQNTAGGGPSNFTAAAVNNVSIDDRIVFRAGSTGDTSIMGMIYFQQAGFLTGNSSISSLNGLEGKLNIATMSVTSAEFRFTVLSGTQWYVSQTTATASGNFTLADLGGTTKWGTWSPTGAPLSTTFGAFDVDGSSLTNVSAFGWYFNASRTGGQANFESPEFIIAIPEPSTWALLAIGLTAVVIFRRRRHTA